MSTAREYLRKRSLHHPAKKTLPHAASLSVIGGLLITISLPFTFVSAGMRAIALNSMRFNQTDDLSTIIEGISRVTWALQWGRLRTRWFFRMVLMLSLVLLVAVPTIVSFSELASFPTTGILFALWWLWCLAWARDEFPSKARKALPA